MNGPDCIEAQACRGDFWCKLETAMQQCGGGIPIERLSEMPLKDIVDILAQNGIRMTYDPSWHIEHLRPRTEKFPPYLQ